MSLTHMQITRAKPAQRAYKLVDADALYLVVNPNGTKLWRMNYRYRRPKIGANGSLNVRREQSSCMHRKRRTDNRSWTIVPLTGKSERVRSYRLWYDADLVPQSGQVASDVAIRPDIRTTPSTTAR